MKKPAAIAVVLGLLLALVTTVAPANAATDWTSLRSELQSSRPGAVVAHVAT